MAENRSLRTLIIVGAVVSLALQGCGLVQRGFRPVNSDTRDSRVETASRWLQEGVASWYGPGFHGRTTANGERYDMHDLTAAHRTLPFNTIVRVVNRDNGRTVDVRINDRGPYVGERIIDLSRGAAETIDMLGPGIANVQLYLVREGDRPIGLSPVINQESYTIQLASFDDLQLAELEASRVNGARVETVVSADLTAYRVYYGHYEVRDDAEEALSALREEGHSGFIKQIEN